MTDKDFSRLAQAIIERHFQEDLDDFQTAAATQNWSVLFAAKSAEKSALGKTESGLEHAFLAASWLITLAEVHAWTTKKEGRSAGTAEKKEMLESIISKALTRAVDAPDETLRLAASIVLTIEETVHHLF
jgi:hypothetical protein